MDILLKNGNIIDPGSGRDEVADVLIVDGVIERIKSKLPERARTTLVDCTGAVIAPGFVDMHVHAREPGFEYKETLATAMAAARSGGFTTICCMPNTDPPADTAAVVEFIRRRSLEVLPRLVDVYSVGAVTKGRQGKELAPMAELARAGAVAFSDDGAPVESSEIMRRALEYSSMVQKPIIQHAEDPSLTKNGVMNEGVTATRLGMPGIPPVAEGLMIERDIRLVEYVLGSIPDEGKRPQYHVAHISTASSVELVRRARKQELPVSCEATPHHFTLTEDAVRTFDTDTKMNPPLRTRDDVEAVKEGLRDGTIDVIATDHAPHSFDEKQVEYGFAPFGVVGLETAIGLALTELVHTKMLSLPLLIEKFSVNPRKILHLPPVTIAEGQHANLTVFDAHREWTVDTSGFKSKSRNSPFQGRLLKGRAVAVVNHGSIDIL